MRQISAMDMSHLVADEHDEDEGLNDDPPAYVPDGNKPSVWSDPPPAYTATMPPPYSESQPVDKANSLTQTSEHPVFARRIRRLHQSGPIKDYMGLSILNLFFCFPLAIGGIILSLKVREYLATRDLARAREASRSCFMVNMIAMVVGIMLIIGITVAGAMGFQARDI